MTAGGLAAALAANAAFLVVALAVGDPLLCACERLVSDAGERARHPSLARLGAALLAGFGALACIGVVLGLARIFSWISLLAVAIAAVALARETLAVYARHLASGVVVLRAAPANPLMLAGFTLALILVVVNYGAALAPPTGWDELNYHLPDARELVERQSLPLTFSRGAFYGNLPKLMEVLFAEALAFDGGAVAHALHFSVLAAFLLFAFGTVRELFGGGTALLAVVLLLLFDDLAQGASTAYVDAGVAAYEVAALLAAAVWIQSGSVRQASHSALFAGLAVGMKYSAAATLLFVGATWLVGAVALRRWRPSSALRVIAPLAAIAAAAGGFWYVKNAVRYGNPFYPLVFGHRGISEVEYRNLVDAIREFGPRNLGSFLTLPERYASFASLPAFLSFYLAPFALLVRRSSRFMLVLVAYFALYTAYWFWIATHQERFLIPAVTTALILAAIAVAWAPRPAAVAAMAVVAVVAVAAARPYFGVSFDRLVQEGKTKLRASQWLYTLGIETKDEYLERQFGCQYEAVAFMNRHRFRGDVVDNWTVWHDPPVGYYAEDNRFVPLALDASSPAGVWRDVRRHGLRFVYVRSGTKKRFFASRDPQLVLYRRGRAAAERMLLERSKRIWRRDDCALFRIGSKSSQV
ncbi:MAG: hypothetical protein M3322_13150 [Actinomycetota bacterium]|nr:hypothetical protein [Actinomycetota bacterium]